MTRGRLLSLLLLPVLLAAGGMTVVLAVRSVEVTVTASSSSAGSDPAALLDPAGGADVTPVPARPASWRSDGETTGAWVQLTWSEPTPVDHVEVRSAGDDGAAFGDAVLAFDGGGSLLLTADEHGDVILDFPERRVSGARLTFAAVPDGARSVTLAALAIDDSGDGDAPKGSATGSAEVRTSSGERTARALVDGSIGEGEAGDEWQAAADDPEPWVELTWSTPRELASLQVIGPGTRAFDPGSSAAAALHGRLLFDDGSSVVVSGIASGEPQATIVAFTPRIVSSARLVLARTIEQAEPGLREIAVHDAGTTPARWPQPRGRQAVIAPEPADCSAGSDAPDAPPDQLTLVCPTPGSTVEGRTSIVLAAPPGTAVTATAWRPGVRGSPPGGVATVASGTADEAGRLPFELDAGLLPGGPVAIKVQPADGPDGLPPLYVQLVNRGAEPVEVAGSAPEGMTLQWEEDFNAPLSATKTGDRAVYAATKPAPWGPSQFGEAVFADPAEHPDNLTTIENGYLRIRAEPISDPDVPRPYDQDHLGGILSSTRVGGDGFAAQYGHFEARMLAPAGPGTWPAFWMLDSESATERGDLTSEVDAVELYGHNTTSSCHAIHAWDDGEDTADGVTCLKDGVPGDWALSWHTYGVTITPDMAVFTVDGREVHRATGVVNYALPHFWMVDLALGGGWPVDLSATGGVADLYVDWVRVWT